MKWLFLASAALAVSAALLGSYGESTIVSEAWMYPGMVILAIGAAAIGSMVGLGGGLIMVPVMIFMGVSPPMAASTSLAATLSNAVASTTAYAKQKRIDYKEGFKMGAIAAPGSILGAILSSDAEPGVFGLLLAAALTVAAIYIFARSRLSRRSMPHGSIIVILTVMASFFAGTVSSFFGIGSGVVFVPLLVVILGMSMMRAAPTSMFALILTSTFGVIVHILLSHTDAVLAMLLSAGGLVGGLAGARLSLFLGERYLRITATILMLTVSIKLIWDVISTNAQ